MGSVSLLAVEPADQVGKRSHQVDVVGVSVARHLSFRAPAPGERESVGNYGCAGGNAPARIEKSKLSWPTG